jgi:hypothetical protein
MLEKKEKVLEKKAAFELEKAKEFSKAKNKRGTVTPSSASLFFHYRHFGFPKVTSEM